MTEAGQAKGPPKRILIATDLSARCDRALDRAISLAKAWGADLTAVHALERHSPFYDEDLQERLPSWRQKDPAAIVQGEFRRDVAGTGIATVVERGDPVEVILRAAQATNADLIVTGLARDETLGRLLLGSTVDSLVRRSRIPLLIVKRRPRHAYSEILVATDLSESSRHALRTAMAFFPGQKLDIFNAYDAPLAGMTGDPANYRDEHRSVVLADLERFVAETGVPDARRRFGLLADPGDPVSLIHQYVADRGADLVVLGTHGRSAVFDVLLGSTAKAILSALPCDALIVREPQSGSAAG
ncbi:MAG: universal stress protein [Bauldia sp.]|nr:universal stress protein [Bauldia sp.]